MSRFSERRSKVTPMDFEYTSEERKTPPVWDSSQAGPQKRTSSELSSSGLGTGFPVTPQRPHASSTSIGPGFSAFAQSPSSASFIFHTPSSRMATPPPSTRWNPSLDSMSPSKLTSRNSTNVVDLNDVSMEDRSSSPLVHKGAGMKANVLDVKRGNEDDEPSEGETSGKMSLIPTRRVSANAVRRVYSGRNKARSKASRSRARAIVEEDHDGSTDEYTDEDDGQRTTGIAKQESITSNHHYTFNMPSVPVSRSEVPYMLLGYVQFFFNLSLVLVFLYILVHCIITIQRDVEHRISQYRTDLAEQIASCAHLYEINKCFPLSDRVPALARQCADWESCMLRDPSGVGRARVVAETIGEVINSFVEPISWKTLLFGLISLGFLITLINALFSFYRARVAPDQIPAQTHPAIRHASLPPAIFPGTPVHARTYLAPGIGYADPVSPLRLDQPTDWGRTWSGTDIPVRASTPGKGKKRL